MRKRWAKDRVRAILNDYPETRNAENPDTFVMCLILVEDGIITQDQASKIYDGYSINNIVKSRQKIQNSDKEYEPNEETKKKRFVGYMNFRHAWRKGNLDV